MAGIHNRFVAALAIVAIAGFSLTACSKSKNPKTTIPNVTAPAQAAGGNGGGSSAGSSAPSGGGDDASAAAGDDTLLAIGPACQIVTAADIQAAVGIPLGNITGDISGGPQGATNYHSCIWTKDASGTGAAVNIAYGTYASATSALASQKATDTSDASQFPGQTITEVSIGDGGYELVTTGSRPDDVISFTKGQQYVQVEVVDGKPGAAMTIAQKVASKL
ncbi:MAG TPA: hypothetical protein VN683_08670 [Acidothermaceae bacterium]|nr:hypothetical protein [Acidothermaceae bacterium]